MEGPQRGMVMCECQPDAATFWEFQPLLFERYDMAVEFARRRDRITPLLASRWSQLRSKSDDEIARYIVQLCSIEPLCLMDGEARLLVEPCGVEHDTGRPCYFYRKFIPFCGDAELWDLSPAWGLEGEVEGQISNAEFVVGVLHTDEAGALEHLHRQTKAAQERMELQKPRITEFAKALPTIVQHQIARRRPAHQGLN